MSRRYIKMNIVTFDGHKGAGKTTQEVLLQEKIGNDCVILDYCYLPLVIKYEFDEVENHLNKALLPYPEYAEYEPSTSFWLDVPFMVGMERASKRVWDPIPFYMPSCASAHENKIAQYLPRLKELLPNFYILDGLRPPEMIHQEIMGILEGSGRI